MVRWNGTWTIIRNFLFGIVNKEFLIFLFFLALSGGFWLMMSLNETCEQDIPVPVRLVNVPSNAVITDDIDDTVMVTIRDKGFSIFSYLYGSKFRVVTLDFENYARKDGVGVVPASDILKQIYPQLYGSSKVMKLNPDRLVFYYNYGLSKEVPVRLSGRIGLGSSYYLSKVQFWPERVRIYANKHLLDSIRYISTADLNISNITDTIYRKVSLQAIRGVKIVPSVVRVGLYPDVLTEESVEVPIKAINMPDDKILRTFPSRVDVKFIVGANLFRQITPEQFSVVVDYNEIQTHPSDKCTLILRSYPNGIKNPRLGIRQIDYLIEQK